MTSMQMFWMVVIFTATTFLTRVISFLVFPGNKPIPKYVLYLGRVLPFAITGMLIVYCLKDVHPFVAPYGIPELIAVAVTAGLYLLTRKSLIAIAGGTILYMVLVQLVFV